MAQNEHLRSQPLAIFNGAMGALSKRLRSTVPKGFISGFNRSRVLARSTGAIGSNARRSLGV